MAEKKPKTARKKPKKIIRYRKPHNLNVGMIMFGIIFIYIVFSVSTYLRKEKVQFYEVAEGAIVEDTSHTGIILRSEETQYADRTGYLNYYVKEGKRAALGTGICSIDESGKLAEALSNHTAENISLTKEDLANIRRQLSAFSLSYRNHKFNTVYDVKDSLEASVLESVNFNTLDNLQQVLDLGEINFVQLYAPKAGVVSYAIDSYENLQPDQISEAVFDRSTYKRESTKSGGLVESGAPVYKLITDDNWSIVFLMSESDIANFGGQESLNITFQGYTLKAAGKFSMITGTDGKIYGKIDLSNYMVQFISQRYVDFEIQADRAEGLKIPVSAVTTKNFYLVPVDYLERGGDSSDAGFYKEVYSEEGTSIVFVPVTLYNSTDEYYYIDMGEDSQLKAGDYIRKPASEERYQINTTASLEGVYNINKGYTVFKQIEILNQNAEFYIIDRGTRYGLSVFDHIVLNASLIDREGVLIYQ